jgi:hypothetical protein
MQVDPEHLRRHYASLSDEALLDIERADLVVAAQSVYDNEIRQRKLHLRGSAREIGRPRERNAEDEYAAETSGEGVEPDWIEEGSQVYSAVFRDGVVIAPEVDAARAALEAEGIPCHVEVSEVAPAESAPSEPVAEWRVMVPGKLNLHASSVLERDIFNAQFEEVWRTHLEMLSDEDLRAAHPEVVFCGLFDKIDRVVNAYQDEISRRGMKPE